MPTWYAVVDMGTSNTRLSLVTGRGEPVYTARGAFGVRDRAAGGGREALERGLKGLIRESTRATGITPEQIGMMLCSGMITSEIGLETVPHLVAPAGPAELAAGARERSLPEIIPAPVLFIPGIRNSDDAHLSEPLEGMDFMRGEETQVCGAMDLYAIRPPATFAFLSSHTKLVDVDAAGRITRSFTTLSGQIFEAFSRYTLLASSVPQTAPESLDEAALFRGLEAGLKNGALRASLMVRFMDTLMKTGPEERFFFLEGVIIAEDILAIRNSYPYLRQDVVYLGDKLRVQCYMAAFRKILGPDLAGRYLGDRAMEDSAIRGAIRIASLRSELR